MISYPLALPTHTGFAQIELRATNAVAYGRSPFTFAGQAFAYSGQMWQADITLPPMKRVDAEQWIAWLISLRGQLGTFLMGDPNGATARGAATGSPLVNGGSQTGGSLVIDLPPGVKRRPSPASSAWPPRRWLKPSTPSSACTTCSTTPTRH